MHMDGYMQGWGISRKEPYELFDRIDVGLTALFTMLDEKIGKLSMEMKSPANSFRQWMSGVRSRASAIILQCGELAYEEPVPLRAILVTQNRFDDWELRVDQKKSAMPLIEPEVCSIDRLEELSFKPYQREEGRVLRSLLSGELLVLWNGDGRLLETTVEGARTIFDKKPAADLAGLLARDVRNMAIACPDLCETRIAHGNKIVEKRLSIEEFEGIAKRAMRMRRVPAAIHGKMINEIRKTVAH